MKIHHNETRLEDRVLHVLRNDRERTAQQIAQVLGMNKTGVLRCLSESSKFEFRKSGNQCFWKVVKPS